MSIYSSPLVESPVRWLRNAFVRLGLLRKKYEGQFTGIYKSRYWGASGSASGGGSSLDSTLVVRALLGRLFMQKRIRSFVDVPCGDFHWMQAVSLDGVRYTGGDIVAPLIAENKKRHERDGVRFMHLDVINDRLPSVDLVLCRDCLVHLPLADVTKALRNIARSGSTWLLTTTFPTRAQNAEIAPGKWRPLNLQIAPFHLPPPEELVNEECVDADGAYADKSLGLWRCDAIRRVIG